MFLLLLFFSFIECAEMKTIGSEREREREGIKHQVTSAMVPESVPPEGNISTNSVLSCQWTYSLGMAMDSGVSFDSLSTAVPAS